MKQFKVLKHPSLAGQIGTVVNESKEPCYHEYQLDFGNRVEWIHADSLEPVEATSTVSINQENNSISYDQLSDESKETLVSMVQFCIERGYCMGPDEGIKVFRGPGIAEVKHEFRQELEAFCGMQDSSSAS